MVELTYSNQLRYTGAGYLDSKMQPVDTYDSLLRIPKSQRFVGMEIVVLSDEKNNGHQTKYWLNGGTANANWEKKENDNGDVSFDISGDDVEI